MTNPVSSDNLTPGCCVAIVPASKKLHKMTFRVASRLTDPICRTHEFKTRLLGNETLSSSDSKTKRAAERAYLALSMVSYGTLSLFTTLPGFVLRYTASQMQLEPFLHYSGNAPERTIEGDKKLTMLSWNVCCVAGGYSITDGGVVPWRERIGGIGQRILDLDPDVVCLYEVFDCHAGFSLFEQLQDRFAHFYFNIGPKGLGVSSGIFVASKYHIDNPDFTRFPRDTLVGRTKNAAKGVFQFDVASEGKPLARIFATHLQHSEQVGFPTDEEVTARRREMEIVMRKVDEVKDRAILLTGDLNLDEAELGHTEWRVHFTRGLHDPGETWGGDELCATMVGKNVSDPCTLDYTLLLRDTAKFIETDQIQTGYDPTEYSPEALSDHNGLLSTIELKSDEENSLEVV